MTLAIEDAAMKLISKRTGKKKWRVAEILAELKKGVDCKALVSLQAMLRQPDNEMGRLLGVSPKTILRWTKKGGSIPSAEADRLFRIARIIALAMDVFDNERDAISWINGENKVLGGKRPIDIMDADAGVRLVEDTLNGIRYGIYM